MHIFIRLLTLMIIMTVATQTLSASTFKEANIHLKKHKHAYAGSLATISLLNLFDMALRGKKFNKAYFKSILAKQNQGTTLRLAVGTLFPLILAVLAERNGQNNASGQTPDQLPKKPDPLPEPQCFYAPGQGPTVPLIPTSNYIDAV